MSGHSGLGLQTQQASVGAFAVAQRWTLIGEFCDIASGKDDRRPGFQAALARCRQLGAIVVAARLERITSAHTLSQFLEDGRFPIAESFLHPILGGDIEL